MLNKMQILCMHRCIHSNIHVWEQIYLYLTVLFIFEYTVTYVDKVKIVRHLLGPTHWLADKYNYSLLSLQHYGNYAPAIQAPPPFFFISF